jgi:hypothetical protein
MKATQEQYEKAAELYDNDGSVTDLYDYAEKLGIDEWSECVHCDAITPDCHDDACFICGSSKVKEHMLPVQFHEHTPGPWKIAGESNTVHEAHIIESESRTICWTADTIGEDDDEFTSDEDLANALLIAKAPDLLFAAKCALADLEGIMPEFEPSGDREHPAWETIKLLKKAIK